MKLIYKKLIILPLLLIAALSGSESLWTPGSGGLLSGDGRLTPGDIVIVEIDSSSSLSFTSTSSDTKSLTLELSGGEYGELFSFLPSGSSRGDRSVKGSEEYEIKSSIGTRVQEIDDTGRAFIRGVRSVSFEGKEESITLTGWLEPALLGSDKRIDFSRLADARLVFRTLLEPDGEVVAGGDIEEISRSLPTGTGPIGTTTEGAGEEPGASMPAAAQAGSGYQLTDSRKNELLLLYINRIVDIIFK
ncbi:MAG TPA: hypothetical protein ENI06_09485 [Spirochaetales bacterium]|nr:hypothetical protein [Spirochaetales bacterium]